MQPFDLLKFSLTIPAARPLGYKQHALGIDIDCQDYWYAVHNDNTSTDTVIYLPSDLPTFYYVMSLAWIREWFSFRRQLSSPTVYIWFWLHFEHHLKNGGTGQESTQGREYDRESYILSLEEHVWWFPSNYYVTVKFLILLWHLSSVLEFFLFTGDNNQPLNPVDSIANPYRPLEFVNTTRTI